MAWSGASSSSIRTVTSPRSNANKDRFNPRSAVVLLFCATLAVLTAVRLKGAIGTYLPSGEWDLIQQAAGQDLSPSVSKDNATTKSRAVLEVEVPSKSEEEDKSQSPEEPATTTETAPQSTSPNVETATSNAPLTSSEREETKLESSSALPPPPLHPDLATNQTFISLPPSQRPLTKLRDYDYDKYTIRILSWKRAPFLAASVAHHSTCPGVEQIQIVWSVLQEDDDPTHTDNVIPDEVLNNPKVALERRNTNQLTNRFDIQTPAKTLAILSLDDDVLYPCDVLDMGFFLWTQNPTRMVTYFPRKHTVDRKTGQWKYSYWRGKEYSLALTGTAFVHRDYLYWYTHFLPRPMYKYIQDNMNCEDVAMTLFVSKLTGGQKPLAVDKWGMHSRVQLALRSGYSGIKNAGGHMKSRNSCVDSFATQLHVKEELGTEYSPGITLSVANYTVDNPRHHALEEKRREWKLMKHSDFKQIYHSKRRVLEKYAIKRGLWHQGSG